MPLANSPGITGAFSSLGINERARPSQEVSPLNRKVSKNCSTISLPNMVLSSERLTISTKFIRNVCDDEVDSGDQPVDFSKKYCETKLIKNENKETRSCTFNKVVKSYNNSFTMYAETDLDQPTDYSLRYAEDDSDSDRCNKIVKSEGTEFIQDTIKTYCTEDTPYETPFNFSTSTSMSDLRIDDKAPECKLNSSDPQDANVTVISKEIRQNKIKSEYSSGLMSPEKPVNYCEEGTPRYFSRVPSCGSLNSIPMNDPPKQELKEENLEETKKEMRRLNKFPGEAKAVKFEEVVNYAETPLMFSRSSSLASLDSIEQHSIHDDRSSVVSDLSRLTSGVISPSELPDSPSQTVPPSPRPRKTPIIFPPVKKKTEELPSIAQNVPQPSVFEDDVKNFKVESTPLHFSLATSLSSLVDDDVDSKVIEDSQHIPSENKNEELNNLDLNNDLSESSEDEDILAACINIGMQSNKYSHPKSNSDKDLPCTYSEFSKSIGSQMLPVDVQTENPSKIDVTSDSVRTYCTEGTPAILSHAGSNSDLSILSSHLLEKGLEKENSQNDLHDSTSIHQINKVSSGDKINGDLNVSLDMEPPDNHSRRSSFSSLSDDSHESEQALLEECILAGMPKSNISPPKSTICGIPGASEAANDLNLVVQNEIKPIDNDLSEDDEDILDNCIKNGIQSNRFSQAKLNSFQTEFKKPQGLPLRKLNNGNDVINDTVKSYCTEDTPAVLSHAGSSSNLSILSLQGKDDCSDINSNFSDEDGDKLLEECVEFGIAAIAGRAKPCDNSQPSRVEDLRQMRDPKDKVDLTHPEESADSDDTASISSFSDDSYESEQALLQQCIQAGMPKPSKPKKDESTDLTPAEKALLQQCILEGMKKCRITPRRAHEDDSSELTEAEQALLRQCILSGMPKNKNLSQGGPSASRESAELTESERLLLQQCILAGMPKNRGKLASSNGGSRQWFKKSKEADRAEHTCCVHCPRNNRAKQSGHVKGRRKYRERGVVQVRENIVYVASQVLTVKKESVDRTHEKWV